MVEGKHVWVELSTGESGLFHCTEWEWDVINNKHAIDIDMLAERVVDTFIRNTFNIDSVSVVIYKTDKKEEVMAKRSMWIDVEIAYEIFGDDEGGDHCDSTK